MWLLDGDARLSATTMIDRRMICRYLLWWMDREKHSQCGKVELVKFLHYLRVAHERPEGRWGEPGKPATDRRAHQPLRPQSYSNYYRLLRTLFLYCVEDGTLDVSPLKTVKPPVFRADQVQPFTQAQIADLLKAAKATLNPARDEAILLLLLDTGARESEICGLKVGDFVLKERTIRVLGKGNTHRILHLTSRTARAIAGYLRKETREDQEPLFVSVGGNTPGERLTGSGLLQIVRRLGKKAGIEGVRCSPHTFRHTFAVEFLRNGGDPLTLQSLYGHTSLEMTRKYVFFSQADRKAKHAQFSPVAKMKLK